MKLERAFVAGLLSCGAVLPFYVALQSLLPAPLALVLASVATVVACVFAFRLLPAQLDGALRKRPGVVVVWALLALLALVQCVRLSVFMADPTLGEASVYPFDEATVRHQALAAYVYGGELDRKGEDNIYDPALYPDPGEPGAPPATDVANLAPHIEEPFQYPPPFLLFPRLTLALSSDFYVMRAVTYWLNVWLFLLTALVLSRWTGQKAGETAGLLVPAVWIGLPTLFTFQFGQFHLAAICLTLLGLVAIERGHAVRGGALVGLAVAGKLFPGIALVYLAFRKQWRALAWALGTVLLLCAATLLVSGTAPFSAFVTDQLPRLSSGSNVDFDSTGAFSAYNASIFGLVHRLHQLGVAGLDRAHAVTVAWGFSILLLVLAAYAGRRETGSAHSVAIWLSLLTLAALRTPLAPTSYVPASAIWLLMWVAVLRMGSTRSWSWVFLSWLFLNPLPELANPTLHVAITTLCPFTILCLSLWTVFRSPRRGANGDGRPTANGQRPIANNSVRCDRDPIRPVDYVAVRRCDEDEPPARGHREVVDQSYILTDIVRLCHAGREVIRQAILAIDEDGDTAHGQARVVAPTLCEDIVGSPCAGIAEVVQEVEGR